MAFNLSWGRSVSWSRAARAEEARAVTKKAALNVGGEAPPFTLKTVNAGLSKRKIFALKNFLGPEAKEPKDAVVLSFAASYCAPCRRELAELAKLKAKLEKANVLLAVVVIDTEPDGIASMNVLITQELKLEYPALADRFGVVARRYGADQLPMTVVIGPDAKIRWMASGFRDASLKDLLAVLER